MQEAISKANALVEAHEYIRRFENKTVVIKVGGSIMDNPDTLRALVEDVCFLDAVSMHPIIVHGGGKSITAAMEKAGLEAHFVMGRRYTDERTLAIAEHVLINEVNKGIVQMIKDFGHSAMGLHSLSSCAVFAQRLFLTDKGDDGKERRIDVGMVGSVTDVNADLLHALTTSENIPVIAPICRDPSGGKLNVNADSVAGHVAAAVKAEKLVLVSDTHGIRTSEGDNGYVSHLTKAQIESLIDEQVVTGGMLPKVEACFTALDGGVNKAHIVDGRIPHALLLEIYTAEGIGTEIVTQ